MPRTDASTHDTNTHAESAPSSPSTSARPDDWETRALSRVIARHRRTPSETATAADAPTPAAADEEASRVGWEQGVLERLRRTIQRRD
jgi:hypothetical protein